MKRMLTKPTNLYIFKAQNNHIIRRYKITNVLCIDKTLCIVLFGSHTDTYTDSSLYIFLCMYIFLYIVLICSTEV